MIMVSGIRAGLVIGLMVTPPKIQHEQSRWNKKFGSGGSSMLVGSADSHTRRERTEPGPPESKGHPCRDDVGESVAGQAGSMRGRFRMVRRHVKVEARCPQGDQV